MAEPKDPFKLQPADADGEEDLFQIPDELQHLASEEPDQPAVAAEERSAPLPEAVRAERAERQPASRHSAHERRGRRRKPEGSKHERVENVNTKVAQELYQRVLQQTYDIVYNRRDEVTEDVPDGSPEGTEPTKRELEDEEQSYYNMVRGIAKNALGFNFKHDRQIFDKGRLVRQRPTEITTQQNRNQRQEAREYIEALMTERFQQDQTRLTEMANGVRTAAADRGDADVILKEKVKNPRFKKDRGGVFSTRLEQGQRALEELRVHAIMDAVDWFGARVNQVEALMDQLTVRTKDGKTVEERIAALDNHLGFQADVKELTTNLELLQTAKELEISGDDKTKASLKKRIEKQIARAERMVKRFERQQADLKALVKENEKFKIPDYRVARRLVGNALMSEPGSVTDLLLEEMNKRLEGLTPEQEKQFWSVVLELFDEAVPRKEDADRKAKLQRADQINVKLGLWTVDGNAARLNNLQDRTLPDPGELPKNVGQLIERAKKDATTLVEVREKMRRTFAIMGRDFERATKQSLVGSANEDKVAMVDRLNQELDQKQKAAITELMKDDAFKTALGARNARDLKWREEADRPLMKQIRAKITELLKLGTPEKIELKALTALMNPPEEAEAGTEAETAEAEAAAPVPSVYERLMANELPTTLLEGVTIPGNDEPEPNDVAMYVDTLFRKIGDAAGSGPLRDAMKEYGDELLENVATPADMQTYIGKLERIAVDCKELKQEYGPKWALELGLLESSGGGKPQANVEVLRSAMTAMREAATFVDALALDQRPEAVKVLWNKVQPPVRDRLTKLGMSEGDAVFVMLLGIPSKEKQVRIEHSQALNRLAAMLELAATDGVKGQDLLQKVNLLKVLEGGDLEYQVDAIRSVIEGTR